MSKTIRVDDSVWAELEAIRDKRETFSECVARLITVFNGLRGLRIVAEGVKQYAEWSAGRPLTETKTNEEE